MCKVRELIANSLLNVPLQRIHNRRVTLNSQICMNCRLAMLLTTYIHTEVMYTGLKSGASFLLSKLIKPTQFHFSWSIQVLSYSVLLPFLLWSSVKPGSGAIYQNWEFSEGNFPQTEFTYAEHIKGIVSRYFEFYLNGGQFKSVFFVWLLRV